MTVTTICHFLSTCTIIWTFQAYIRSALGCPASSSSAPIPLHITDQLMLLRPHFHQASPCSEALPTHQIEFTQSVSGLLVYILPSLRMYYTVHPYVPAFLVICVDSISPSQCVS
jgi:hypothetical protein